MFVLYEFCAVLVVYPIMNHCVKIFDIFEIKADVRFDVCGHLNCIPYARMIPFLDLDQPHVKRRKNDQFHYIPNCNNSQKEYLFDDPVNKQMDLMSKVIDNLSLAGHCCGASS